MIGDGCGKMLDCGGCAGIDTCGGSGVPSVCGNPTGALHQPVPAPGQLPGGGQDHHHRHRAGAHPARVRRARSHLQRHRLRAQRPGERVPAGRGLREVRRRPAARRWCGRSPDRTASSRWRTCPPATTSRWSSSSAAGGGRSSSPRSPPARTPALTAEQTRLPRNKAEGDIPQMALSTGGVDLLECVLRKMGIDDAEFTAAHRQRPGAHVPGPNANGTPNGTDRFAPALGGAMFPNATTLWGADGMPNNLDKYDVVLTGCQGSGRRHLRLPGQQVGDRPAEHAELRQQGRPPVRRALEQRLAVPGPPAVPDDGQLHADVRGGSAAAR